MGIKVTMCRVDSSGLNPAERLFESADDWRFVFERNIVTLLILKNEKPAPDGSFKRNAIAEFPASGVEAVEII